MAKEEKDTLKDAGASAKEEKKAAKKNTKKAQKHDKKSKKDEGKKQNRVARWFRDLKIEFRNVTWPTRHTVLVNTGIVLATIVVSSAFVGLLDAGMYKLFQFLLELSQS